MTPRSQRPFWKKARGDHFITAALATSMGLTILIALTIFSDKSGPAVFIWFLGSGLAGFFIPLRLVPNEWIEFNEFKIPKHTFWKELLS